MMCKLAALNQQRHKAAAQKTIKSSGRGHFLYSFRSRMETGSLAADFAPGELVWALRLCGAGLITASLFLTLSGDCVPFAAETGS